MRIVDACARQSAATLRGGGRLAALALVAGAVGDVPEGRDSRRGVGAGTDAKVRSGTPSHVTWSIGQTMKRARPTILSSGTEPVAPVPSSW